MLSSCRALSALAWVVSSRSSEAIRAAEVIALIDARMFSSDEGTVVLVVIVYLYS